MENKKYLAILRGINVSGQKMIKVDALKLMYEILKFPSPQVTLGGAKTTFFLLNNI